MSKSASRSNSGFEGRVFLEECEWRTYVRRMPVRYIRKSHATVCEVCGLPPSKDNPLQHSHIIGFKLGVLDLALTPDFLDSHDNIISAHKRGCNSQAELGLDDAVARLVALSIADIPPFVRQFNESKKNGARSS